MPSDEELDFSTTDEDMIVIRRSLEQIRHGDSREVGEFFTELRETLLSMKAEQERSDRSQG